MRISRAHRRGHKQNKKKKTTTTTLPKEKNTLPLPCCKEPSLQHLFQVDANAKANKTPKTKTRGVGARGCSYQVFSLIHLSAAKTLRLLILILIQYNCLHHHSEHMYCSMTVIISHPLWLKQKANTSPRPLTRTHGYISAFAESPDLADRVQLLGWNEAPANYSSQNMSTHCLQTQLVNLYSMLLQIYTPRSTAYENFCTVHFALYTLLFILS